MLWPGASTAAICLFKALPFALLADAATDFVTITIKGQVDGRACVVMRACICSADLRCRRCVVANTKSAEKKKGRPFDRRPSAGTRQPAKVTPFAGGNQAAV
jgi:hypothetical protein